MDLIQNGKSIRPFEPAPSCSTLVTNEASTLTAPTLATEGVSLDPHYGCISIEVEVDGSDGTSLKGIKLWLLSRALNNWHDPDEGIVTDLQDRPGDRVFYVLADPWLYERAYLEITQNDGAGTINANIIAR